MPDEPKEREAEPVRLAWPMLEAVLEPLTRALEHMAAYADRSAYDPTREAYPESPEPQSSAYLEAALELRQAAVHVRTALHRFEQAQGEHTEPTIPLARKPYSPPTLRQLSEQEFHEALSEGERLSRLVQR